MGNFIVWLFESFYNLLYNLTLETVYLIGEIVADTGSGAILEQMEFNLVLFSETPILTTDLYQLLTLFFSIFYSVIFIVIVYKIIKKVVIKITGWKRW